MIFLLLQIYYIAFVLNVRLFEHLRCFDCFSNYHLNIWDESTWSLSLSLWCGRDHLTLTDGIMTRIYKIICSTGLICIFSVTLYAVLAPSVCDSHSTGQQTLTNTQTCLIAAFKDTTRSELTLICASSHWHTSNISTDSSMNFCACVMLVWPQMGWSGGDSRRWTWYGTAHCT